MKTTPLHLPPQFVIDVINYIFFYFVSINSFIVFFGGGLVFLGPYLWHMEVPRLGVELEL